VAPGRNHAGRPNRVAQIEDNASQEFSVHSRQELL
jgi:hypothetical protein